MYLPRGLVLVLAFFGGGALFAAPLLGAALLLTPAAPTGPASATATSSIAPAASAAASGSAESGMLHIEAFDLGFKPAALTVEKPGTYQVMLTNTGAVAHNVTFADGTKIEAKPGETAAGQVEVPDGGLSFICDIPGHAEAGMRGSISIAGATTAGGGNQGGDHGGPPPATDVQPDPKAPEYAPRDAAAPAALSGTTHDVDLVVEEKNLTVAPGFVQAVWTFNSTVPGPVIRVHVGDKIRVHLKNPATNKLSHSVDFHASQVAWNDEMTSIARPVKRSSMSGLPTTPVSGCTTAARRRRSTTSQTACTAW